jgi:hypothetical protein
MTKTKIAIFIFLIVCFISDVPAQYVKNNSRFSVGQSKNLLERTALLPPIGETENSNSLYIGLLIPTGRLSKQVRPGFSVGYDYNFNFERNVDFFLNITGNLFSTKKSDSISTVERIVDIAVLLEYTIGPRLYFDIGDAKNRGKYKMSTELGIGFYTPIGTQYIFDESGSFSGIEGISDVLRGGVNLGVGAYITGNRTIVVKLKYHKLFSIPTQYFGLYGGIVL